MISKGPWKLSTINRGPDGIESVVDVGEYFISVGEHEDAQLVAAAPDLLEAAKEALDHFQKLGVVIDCADALALAINKAEGKK